MRYFMAAAAALFAYVPASAAVVVVDETLVNFQSVERISGGVKTASLISFQAGDTLDLTIRFGTTATISRPLLNGEFWVELQGDTTPNFNPTNPVIATYELLNATGDLATTGSAIASGPTLRFSKFLLTAPSGDVSGSFDGIRIVYDIGGAKPGVFDVIRVYAGIPEPSSWALMIAGFGMAGAAARRPRRTAQAV
jgi:hypothetical protein